jgi:hypothetical protein
MVMIASNSLRRATKLAREPSSLSYKGLKDVTRKRDSKVDDDLLAYLSFGPHLLCLVPSGGVGPTPICISSPIQYYWHRAAPFVCARQGDAQREGYDAMPMRRTIGISLACLVTSACAMGKTPQESTSHYPDQTADLRQENAEVEADKSRGFQREEDACSGILA